MSEYPPDALSSDGTPWWEVRFRAGGRGRSKFGDEPRIAAWLAYNKRVGDYFTTDELREAIRDLDTDGRNVNEHLQRRLRELRNRDSWKIPSNKYVKSIPPGRYRLDEVGWHPGTGLRRPPQRSISKKTRRLVFDRDGSRCVICGVASGEPYPDEPNRSAVLTMGHVTPRALGGRDEPSNLRTECSLCNETMRARTGRPVPIEDALEILRELTKAERQQLFEWLQIGHRVRNRLDLAYDMVRFLHPDDAESAKREVARSLGID